MFVSLMRSMMYGVGDIVHMVDLALERTQVTRMCQLMLLRPQMPSLSLLDVSSPV